LKNLNIDFRLTLVVDFFSSGATAAAGFTRYDYDSGFDISVSLLNTKCKGSSGLPSSLGLLFDSDFHYPSVLSCG
jgi:hypothetical protein